MSECKIYLENYSGTYYVGSEIRGRVECYFDDETTLRGVKIRLKCKEHNEWTGTETYTDPSDHKTKTRHITLTGNRDVLYVEQMLFGSDSGSRVLNRGKHVYPFSFVLPHDVPSSFNGPYGRIFYKLKAVVDRPMRMDYEDNFQFSVVSPIDLNRLSKDLQEVTTYSDDKTVCCWCCKGGNISMDVELPKLAFVPGEVINLRVTVTNMSNSSVDSLKVKFTKTVTYKVTSPKSEKKHDVDNIISINEHGVGAHGEHTYDVQLAIPEYLDVPNFTNCDLFEVDYQLDVSCEMPACTLDLDISVYNIELGHIQYYDGTGQNDKTVPGYINNIPPMDGTYPPALPYPAPGGGDYPPPPGATYPPPPPGATYPPPPGGNYPTSPSGGYPAPPGGSYPPPPGGSYPTPAGGSYPPSAGGSYPPPADGSYPLSVNGSYPPPAGGSYPPPSGGNYPPTSSGTGPSYPAGPPAYGNSFEKPVYSGGQPTAPTSSIANAPIDDNPKAREAASSTPSAPYGSPSEPPPPSYSQVQQNASPYPPQ